MGRRGIQEEPEKWKNSYRNTDLFIDVLCMRTELERRRMGVDVKFHAFMYSQPN
jgi:hypothetical protein